jgi:Trk K+ transport system NAD-binding subunit
VNRTVPILARAARTEEDEPLRPAGATSVVAPEQAGAELLAEQALAVLRAPVV